MKKLQRVTAIFLLSIFSVLLVGCGQKTPTEVVNQYFSEVKQGKNAEVSDLLDTQFGKTEEGVDNKDKMTPEEEKKVMDLMKQMDAKVNSEKIDEKNKTAIVNVTVKGPNFADILLKVMGKAMEIAFSGKELTEEQTNEIFMSVMDNPTIDERTGDINLEMVDSQWKITPDDNLMKVLLGNVNNNLNENALK